MKQNGLPVKQGLYDPRNEHDACGIGFVANINGARSHQIIRQALTILVNLAHRGGSGSEANTGDGAGILIQIPHQFFETECTKAGISLPPPEEYGVGMVFLTNEEENRKVMEASLERIVNEEGQTVLGWRDVPTNPVSLGKTALECMPFMRQIFIGRNSSLKDTQAFERKLYIIRKRAEKASVESGINFYIASLSSKTIVYKGMLTAEQVDEFYKDLSNKDVKSALALVHSRYSTNTFPSWERAHPNRYLCHNGEINTLQGNVNWMAARETNLKSELFGDDLKKVFPVINPDGSDSAMFDNCLEFLTLSGRSLPHSIMMMIPEPWSNHESMSDEKKAFYEFHSCLMEPWDGPAAMGFTDGSVIGAILDRNGLRPARYYVTKDGQVIMSSEVGVLDIDPERILSKERLMPGRMLLIDTVEGRIINDRELKHKISHEHPYRKWLDTHLIELENLPAAAVSASVEPAAGETVPTGFTTAQAAAAAGDSAAIAGRSGSPAQGTLLQRQKAFGYTYEELRKIIGPMVKDGAEPIGAMGIDTPLAVLSDKPQLLYNYFKQLFAQVTNPPIDALREEIITATETFIGTEGDLINPKPESCSQIKLKYPVISNEDLARIKNIDIPGFKTHTMPILFKASEGTEGLRSALESIFSEASKLISGGTNILILTDRGISREFAPIPALLAVSGLHHHLIREGTRTRVSIVLESGEPREIHHFALLIGYGVSAVNPYMVFETIEGMVNDGILKEAYLKTGAKKYIKTAVKGIVKTISKMGISTIQSYQGAQIFEAVGISQEIIDRYFTKTVSPLEGIGLDVIAGEALIRHSNAYDERSSMGDVLETGGQYQWRKDGEYHLYNPETIHKLQCACRTNDYKIFGEYSKLLNEQTQRLCTIRGLLDFKYALVPVPIEEVESVESIVKRFKTGAMSYGSISKEAHEALAIAMNRIGGKSNTGEGGEDTTRFRPDSNGDSRCSAIKQVASGRFGVTSNYLVNAKELQIKMAQGAKPGEGGQLPGQKVYPWVGRTRHSTPGVGLISPPPHHDIYSIEDLAELIHDLKNANRHARISVKLVSEAGVGTIAAGVAKGRADVVLISGYDGGTGASPRSSIRHAGLPWELGLAETHQTLMLNDLRSRIVVETDGKLMTGRDVAVAALLGAEEFGFATAPLVTLGCVMMRVCNLDTCPVGIATQNPELRKKFSGDPQYVVNFMHFIAQELREWMSKLGFRTIEEMVGRSDLLEANKAILHWKSKGLDLSPILFQPELPEGASRYCQTSQDHLIEKTLDMQVLLDICKPALEKGETVSAELPVKNTNRVVGTILGSEVTAIYGEKGLPEDTINLKFHGSAGQSFGAFIPAGISLTLEGDSNDYLGKGLSGGKIIVHPPVTSTFAAEENIIAGNVCLYGATSGEAYINGMAGERFCVRNSGATAVVESLGDHGCEYMTGGRVIVLGSTGRNFAAGMSGGIAYVLDENKSFSKRCNKEMVDLKKLEDREEIKQVHDLIRRHYEYTGSLLAKRILESWTDMVPQFVKVLPRDYDRMLKAINQMHVAGLTGEEALLAAFESVTKEAAKASDDND
jgi:glutamate synthase (NADPH/NADH) large chain